MRSKQGGFILGSPLLMYGAIAAVALIGVLSVSLWVQTNRLESTKQAFQSFVIQTKVIGEKQNNETKLENARLIQKVKEANDETITLRTKFDGVSKRLRDNSTSRSYLPAATSSTSRADLACFNRAELDSTIRSFTREVSELVIEGESKSIDLDIAKNWGRGLRE